MKSNKFKALIYDGNKYEIVKRFTPSFENIVKCVRIVIWRNASPFPIFEFELGFPVSIRKHSDFIFDPSGLY